MQINNLQKRQATAKHLNLGIYFKFDFTIGLLLHNLYNSFSLKILHIRAGAFIRIFMSFGLSNFTSKDNQAPDNYTFLLLKKNNLLIRILFSL